MSSATQRTESLVPVPRVWPLLITCFAAYAKRYVKRHFHALRLSQSPPYPPLRSGPLVIYLNHASWWDPLVCLILHKYLCPTRQGYAPIDASALRRYPMFQRLGFFGVEPGTRRGAIDFLKTSTSILQQRNTVLWITPQGKFQDVRTRPVLFQPGLGHLATRLRDATFLPIAIEYGFWEERLPELFIEIGEPMEISSSESAGRAREERSALGPPLLGRETWTPAMDMDSKQSALAMRRTAGRSLLAQEWSALLGKRLTQVQDHLAQVVQERDPRQFRSLVSGRAGVAPVYDFWRSCQAFCRGERFHSKHGAL